MLTLLLFPPSPSLPDRLVAHLEGGPTDAIHCAIQLDDTWLVEAVEPVVRAMPVASLPANVRRCPLTLTSDQEAMVRSYLLARVGRERYSIRQIFVDAVGLATHRWLPSPQSACDCSGYVASALVAAGVVSTVPRDPDSLTPQDLTRWADAGMPTDLGALLTAPATVA